MYEKYYKLKNEIVELQQSTDVSHGMKNAIEAMKKEIDIIFSVINQPVQKKFSKLIQIGGGKNYLKEFINIDLFEPADIICDVREGIPLPNQCATFIYCEHFLEHLDYPKSVELFLKECYRLLQADGKIVIGVPNSFQAVSAYINGDIEYFESHKERWIKKKDAIIDSYIDILNYHFRDVVNHPKYTPHYWAYDEEKLKKMLARLGYKNAYLWDLDKKLVNLERYQRTLYVEALK